MAADANLDGKWLPMDQPPLLKLLQNILREYRADAQIIHELIQNAEDAEATTIKIMYEPRESNPSTYQEYFQSPALIIHNDAIFKDDDWENIRSVCMSQKETKADKIGKYGQGFKSIFHLTDHPVVISGKKVLLINPFRHLACGYFSLGSIFSGKSVLSDVMASAFDMFGLEESNIQEGFYDGTLFWFPLRRHESELSKNIPHNDTMMTLLEGFYKDASIVLLFLSNLRTIEIYDSFPKRKILKVEKQESTSICSFDQLSELPENIARSVEIKEIEIETETQADQIEKDNWVITKFEAPVDTVHDDMNSLGDNFDTTCSPFITIAYNKMNPTNSGRVFNYLPLPATCLSGLPVHLHGPFAVNQNRSELKFPDGQSQDKYVKWNEIIFKLLPEVYQHLALCLISKCEQTERDVLKVLKSFPNDQNMESRWKPFIEPVFSKLLELPIFFTEMLEKRWIRKEMTLIFSESFDTNPENSEEMRNALKLLLLDRRQPVTSLTENMTSLLTRTDIKEIQPSTVANHLQESSTIYNQYSDDIKHHLLAFILQDLSIDFSGIELIPLQNMTYEDFHILESDETSDKIFLMLNDDQKLFPGMEHRIVRTASLSDKTLDGLIKIAENGKYQIRLLSLADLPEMLQTVFDTFLEQKCDTTYTSKSVCPLGVHWINDVWKKIRSFKPENLEQFEDLPLIPQFKTGSTVDESCIQNYFTLKKKIMVSSYEGCRQIPKIIEDILESEGVVILPYPCEFIECAQHLLVDQYIKVPTFDTLMVYCKNNMDLQRKIQNILGFKRILEIPSSECTSAVSFGQKEDLTTRIRGILADHPLDHSFLNELLQNADDAGASKIHFVYDMRDHTKDGIFDERWEPLLGPALCVFNDACFTDADLKGIQDLGLGSKVDDDTKTGKFGIGFNAVYHLTDAPSFITKGLEVPNGGVFCVLDPHCIYAPYAHYDNPGMRMNLDELRMKYSGVYNTHLLDQFGNERGTWFRFPLRNKVMVGKSKIKNEICDEKEVLSLLTTMEKYITESLIFLLNVKSICISRIDKNSDQMSTDKAEVYLTETDLSERMDFRRCVKEQASRLSSGFPDLNAYKEVQYQMEVRQTNKEPIIFKVVQNIGFNNTDRSFLHLSEKMRRLPLGGAAVQICPLQDAETLEDDQTYTTPNCRIFNVLPLPVSSGLGVHINGHFELESSRLQLFDATCTTTDSKHKWNQSLMQFVVSHAVKRIIIELKQSISSTQPSLRKLYQFFRHLPVFDSVTQNYCRELVYWVYHYIKKEAIDIFPVCSTEDEVITVKWVSEGSQQNAVFIDNLSDQISPEYKYEEQKTIKECQHLRNLFIDIGIKLTNLPLELRNSFSNACKFTNSDHSKGVNCICKANISPKIVECFFRENDQTLNERFVEQRCSSDAVVCCFRYLLRGLDYKDIIGLPVLLTNNGKIRRFCEKNDLYLSEYCNLLKESGECFVHKSLQEVITISSCKSETKCSFNSLGAREFSELLPKSFDRDVFRKGTIVKWNDHKYLMSDCWMNDFLKFLKTCIDDKKSSVLEHLSNWCLLPAVKSTEQVLVPIGKSRIIDFSTFSRNPKLKTALKKLGAPEPLKQFLTVPSLMATYSNPGNVLDCFEYWITTMGTDNMLTPEDYSSILSYLGGRAYDISSNEVARLKQMSIFETVTGNMTNVCVGTLLAIPTFSEMPSSGLDCLFHTLNVTAIKHNPDADALYERLGVKVLAKNSIHSPLSELYTEWILPNLDKLSLQNRTVHLTFIAKYMLEDGRTMEKLKHTPFIEKDGNLKKASEFYDRKHKLFKKLCLESEFPPPPYDGLWWASVMQKAGIQKEVSKDILIKFARRLSDSALETEFENAKLLVVEIFRFLKTHKADKQFIDIISSIRFIVPQEPSETNKIYPGEGNRAMMQFRGSLSNDCYNKVWTVVRTLPDYATNYEMSTRLGFQITPNEEIVLEHVENICSSLHLSCKKHDKFLLQYIMNDIYKFFNDQSLELQDHTIERLSNIPFIHIMKNEIFIEPRRIVKYLSEEHEIIPYLVQAPEEYGSYFDLFRRLGMNETTSFQTYCRVLNDIYKTVGMYQLEPNQIKHVEKAIRGLVQILDSSSDIEMGDQVLTLMTADKRLMQSSQICFETDESERQRLSNETVNVNLIADMSVVDLNPEKMDSLFSRLPEEHRPRRITSIISEEVLTDFERVETDLTKELHDFLTSSHFVTAVLRFVNANAISYGRHLEEQEVIDITSNIRSLQINCIKDLQTVFVFRSYKLETTLQNKGCFFDDSHGILYINSTPTDVRTWLSKYDNKLSCIVKTICGGKIRTEDILKIITKIDLQPAELLERLDLDLHLPQLGDKYIPTTWVPLPGSLVPTELHKFIKRATIPLKPKQYVVYKHVTMGEGSYKYAVVIDSCFLPDEQLEHYILNIGDVVPYKANSDDVFLLENVTSETLLDDELNVHEDNTISYYDDQTLRAAVLFRNLGRPNPNPSEGKRWLQQARHDLEISKILLKGLLLDRHSGFNWICIVCQQAAEKAIKAAQYSIDADNVVRTHDLLENIPESDKHLPDYARQLTSTIGRIECMRYPMNRTIPAHLYTEEDARNALDLTEKILANVKEQYVKE